MTTITSSNPFDLPELTDLCPEQSLWSRLLRGLSEVFERMWIPANEDIGWVEGDDYEDPSAGCCY